MKNLFLKVLVLSALLGFSSVSAIEFTDQNVVAWELPKKIYNWNKTKRVILPDYIPETIIANYVKESTDKISGLHSTLFKTQFKKIVFMIFIGQKNNKLVDVSVGIIDLDKGAQIAQYDLPISAIQIY